MPRTLNTYGDISPRTAAYVAKQLLERGQFLMTIERFGQAKTVPKNNTQVVTFRRYESLPRATSPLAEGVPPTGSNLVPTDVSATLQQYGDWVPITDVIADTHEDPVLKEVTDMCGEQAAETIEAIRISKLTGGTNVFYANAVATRLLVTSTVSRGDLRRITRALNKYKARTISQIVSASANVATEPVDAAFFAMCHTDLDADIRNVDNFVSSEYYSKSGSALPGEIGKVENIRFITTPLFDPWLAAATSISSTSWLSNGVVPGAGAAPDVYPILITGQNAYGIVPLQGSNAVVPMVKNPGQPSVGDPVGQIGFVSWKTWQTAIILNNLWMARYEVAATGNPT